MKGELAMVRAEALEIALGWACLLQFIGQALSSKADRSLAGVLENERGDITCCFQDPRLNL